MTRRMRWSILAVIAAALSGRAVQAATYTAASCNESDVRTAINNEQAHPADGDIISIPVGSCTWTGSSGISLTFNNSITIQGAGAISAVTGGGSTTGSDATAITDNLGNPGIFAFTTVVGKSLRVTGIAFLQNASSAHGFLLVLQGSSTAVRLDHCHFHVLYYGAQFYGSILGVADHNYYDTPTNQGNVSFSINLHNGATWQGAGDLLGYQSWVDTDHWGSSEFFFIEDSRFYNGGVSDSHDGARYVFRYNTVAGDGTESGQMYAHSLAEGQPSLPQRAVEVYGNNISNGGDNSNPFFTEAGGPALFWGNTISGGYNGGLQLTYKRTSVADFAAPPNDWGNCGLSGGIGWDGKALSNGYPCLAQPGRGAGDLLSGTGTPPYNFPTICNSTDGDCTAKIYTGGWAHQVLDPVYVWDNSYTQNPYKGNLISLDTNMADIVSDNRDYYQQLGTYAEPGSWNGTAGINQSSSAPSGTCTAGTDPMTGTSAPGVGWWDTSNNTLYVCNPKNTWTSYYTPYTYPHPLTQSAGTVAPNAPTNLTATVQ
jgi:hypothetical protein